MRRNRKTDGLEKRGFKPSPKNVFIYKQRNGKGYKKYKLIPILLDKYYLVNFSDFLYPYIVKRGFNSKKDASTALKQFYSVNKRDSFNIMKGIKLSKLESVVNGSIRFKIKPGFGSDEIKVNEADAIAIVLTKFLDSNPPISKLMRMMRKEFLKMKLIWTDEENNKLRLELRQLGLVWPLHIRAAISLYKVVKREYTQLCDIERKHLTIGLLANEPKVMNKVVKPLSKNEIEYMNNHDKKIGLTKNKLILEAMYRGFQSYKTEKGEYKRTIDLKNKNYLIIPLSLFDDGGMNNRDPILIYPRPFQFSINDDSNDHLGYERLHRRKLSRYFSIWEAWQLMDTHCIPRVADIHRSDNISKDVKRNRRNGNGSK